jgi:hypothetical protein
MTSLLYPCYFHVISLLYSNQAAPDPSPFSQAGSGSRWGRNAKLLASPDPVGLEAVGFQESGDGCPVVPGNSGERIAWSDDVIDPIRWCHGWSGLRDRWGEGWGGRSGRRWRVSKRHRPFRRHDWLDRRGNRNLGQRWGRRGAVRGRVQDGHPRFRLAMLNEQAGQEQNMGGQNDRSRPE